jgi:hypothetical protein
MSYFPLRNLERHRAFSGFRLVVPRSSARIRLALAPSVTARAR